MAYDKKKIYPFHLRAVEKHLAELNENGTTICNSAFLRYLIYQQLRKNRQRFKTAQIGVGTAFGRRDESSGELFRNPKYVMSFLNRGHFTYNGLIWMRNSLIQTFSWKFNYNLPNSTDALLVPAMQDLSDFLLCVHQNPDLEIFALPESVGEHIASDSELAKLFDKNVSNDEKYAIVTRVCNRMKGLYFKLTQSVFVPFKSIKKVILVDQD